MIRKQLLATFGIGTGLILILAVFLLLPTPVSAQCGEPPRSSCLTCHEQQAPVADQGEWHIIHASKDICIDCHGGNASAMDKALAHQGLMTQPLSDIYTDCHSCHPDYDVRAAQFAPTLGVTPGSCATPTPFPAGNLGGGPPAGSMAIQSALMTTSLPVTPYWILSGAVTMLALFLVGLGWLARHPG